MTRPSKQHIDSALISIRAGRSIDMVSKTYGLTPIVMSRYLAETCVRTLDEPTLGLFYLVYSGVVGTTDDLNDLFDEYNIPHELSFQVKAIINEIYTNRFKVCKLRSKRG